MKKIRKIKIKSFKSTSGKLIPISFNKKFPFSIKRIFFLYGKEKKIRGDHAHKKCSQLFMAVSGKMILNIKSPYSKRTFSIGKSSKYAIFFHFKTNNWRGRLWVQLKAEIDAYIIKI